MSWNITQDKSIFWRKDPSELEAAMVIASSGSAAVLGVLAMIYVATFLDNLSQPPENTEDLEEVVDDNWETTLCARPSASKPINSQYRKLLDKNDIRILVLHPGQFDDEVRVDMEHISLGQRHPKYEALSYAWGNRTTTKVIHNLDKTIPVTANLHSALQHLRYENRSRKLWIDALCIDQNDIDERNQQVRLMGDVFLEAERVVVWLGEKSADTAKSFSSLKVLHANYCLYNNREGEYFSHILWSKDSTDRVLQRSIALSAVGRVIVSNLHDVDWNSIQSLLHRAWFHRLWVIQEVSHAKRAVVICGDATVPWSTLSRALSYLVDHDLTSKYLDRYCTHACNNVVSMEKMRNQKTRDPLFAVILANAYGGCSDSRDKIFAMMSISDGRDIFDWEISFDYGLSTSELFKRFAIWDIIRNGSLRSLSCATTGLRDFRLPPLLPSWVPDWNRLPDKNLLVRSNATSKFSASLKTESDVWFTHNKERMHVRGAIVDHIHTIGSVPYFIKSTSVFEIDESVIRQLVSMNEWFRECWDIAKAGQPMTTATYEAFWRTMLCGLTGSGHPAPKSYSGYFRQYLKFMRQAPDVFEKLVNDPDPVLPTRLSAFTKLADRIGFFSSSLEDSYTQIYSREFHQWFNEHAKTNSLIEKSLQTWATRKRFCRTEGGRLARVPEKAAVGDSICILHGSEVPYVLRLQEDGTFTVVGECYAHGIMHGEALEHPSYQPEIFTLR